MQLADILPFINSDLPRLDCRPGCVDCCTVAFWTRQEWIALPQEHKDRVGLVTIPMRGPGNVRLKALLPVEKNQVMGLAMRKKLAVTMVTAEGLLLNSWGLENIRCPFAREGEGCTVYEYRPFVCRIMGASGSGRMRCPHNIEPDEPLCDDVILQRFLLWTNLLEKSQE